MSQAQVGDTVRVHYTGKLADGTVFDSSVNREPLEFTLGEQQVIPGFEKAIVGMNQGETRTSVIRAEEAYGPYRDERVLTVDRDQFPEHIQPQVGLRLQVSQGEQQPPTAVTITDVSEEHVVLDANHPLAGQDLTFEIELVSIA